MAAFHDADSSGGYSPRARATIAAAAAALLVAGAAAVVGGPLHRAALAIAVAALAAPLGCALGLLASSSSRSAALVLIVGIGLEGVFLGVLGDVAAALRLGVLALGLLLAGAGIARALARASLPALGPLLVAAASVFLAAAPFALAFEGAPPRQLEWARALFVVGPLSAASGAVEADLLRNDRLYAISTLGSSLPVGYPPAWFHGMVLGLIGVVLHTLTRIPRHSASRSPRAFREASPPGPPQFGLPQEEEPPPAK